VSLKVSFSSSLVLELLDAGPHGFDLVQLSESLAPIAKGASALLQKSRVFSFRSSTILRSEKSASAFVALLLEVAMRASWSARPFQKPKSWRGLAMVPTISRDWSSSSL